MGSMFDLKLQVSERPLYGGVYNSALVVPVAAGKTSPRSEEQDEARANAKQRSKDRSFRFGGAVGLLFLALLLLTLLFAHPLVMVALGDAHGPRFLVRLGSTLGVVAAVGALGGVFHLMARLGDSVRGNRFVGG
jgi:hypothetical protein